MHGERKDNPVKTLCFRFFKKNYSVSSVVFLIFFMSCSFTYETDTRNDDAPNVIMENAEYVRIYNGNPEIRVTAEEVRRYEVKHTMELDNFTFEQFNAAPESQEAIPDINARGKAAFARMETDTNNAFVRGNISIEVVSEDIKIETPELSWEDKERLLNAPGTVNISRSDGTTMTGTGFKADVRSRNWEFESAIEGSVVDND